ncbi:MAG: hypothetical protein ACRD82_10920 [Blastocatellia bacterium]
MRIGKVAAAITARFKQYASAHRMLIKTKIQIVGKLQFADVSVTFHLRSTAIESVEDNNRRRSVIWYRSLRFPTHLEAKLVEETFTDGSGFCDARQMLNPVAGKGTIRQIKVADSKVTTTIIVSLILRLKSVGFGQGMLNLSK